MNLVWLYIWLRRLAYLLGLIGFVLMIVGKQSGEKDPWSLRVGFLCIVGMTVLFLCNYALWMYLRFRKKPVTSQDDGDLD